MAETSVQEKFEKAVNVIRNLPKNGSYQPSHELQLRFYAYFKQATEGINTQPKPGMWQIVKKAKWDAWSKLGNMTKEEAMIHYVEELRKIVETMSYTDNVASFLNSLDGFYENVPPEDLELLVGPIIEKMRSRPNSPLSGSPLASRDTSPDRIPQSREKSPIRLNSNNVGLKTNKHITSSLETSPSSSYTPSPLPPDTEEEEEDDNFLDTNELPMDQLEDVPTSSDYKFDNGWSKLDSKLSQIERKLKVDGKAVVDQSNASSAHSKEKNSHLVNNYTHSPITGNSSSKDIANAVNDLSEKFETLKTKIITVEHKYANQPRSVSGESTNSSRPGQSTLETLKNAVDVMTRDMENLQRRMISLENRRQQEKSRRGGVVVPTWWGIPVQTTAVMLIWPVLILLVSKWLSRRQAQRH